MAKKTTTKKATTTKKSKSTPLTKEQISRLKKVGITGVETEEESRQLMVAKLAELDIPDDGESWDEMLEIIAAFEDEEIENDELADEVESEEEDSEEEDSDEEDLDEEDEEDEEDEDEEDEEDLDEEDLDEEEEDEEETTKKSTKKEAKKTSSTKKEKPAAKEKSKKEAKPKKVSKKFNPKANEEDAEMYEPLIKAIKKNLGDNFSFTFLANGGLSIKYLGKNSTKGLFAFEPKIVDGELVGRVYSTVIKEEEKLEKLFGDQYDVKQDWSGIPAFIEVTQSEIIESLKENKKEFLALVDSLEGKDKKLGKNREKMEEQLKETKKAKAETVKKSVSKKADKKAKAEKPAVKEKSTKKKSTKK